MITSANESSVRRVTVTLDPIDLDLIDRLARVENQNRSEELRSILLQLRPMLTATVEAFEAALAKRDEFDRLAAEATLKGLEGLLPEVERLHAAYLGALSRIEGRMTASEAGEAPASNTGATE